MIRFHEDPGALPDVRAQSSGNDDRQRVKLRVSSKRKPRGYVVRTTTTERITGGDGRYEMSVLYRVVDGWVPFTLKGRPGPFCYTLQEAVQVIMTHLTFQRP